MAENLKQADNLTDYINHDIRKVFKWPHASLVLHSSRNISCGGSQDNNRRHSALPRVGTHSFRLQVLLSVLGSYSLCSTDAGSDL